MLALRSYIQRVLKRKLILVYMYIIDFKYAHNDIF